MAKVVVAMSGGIDSSVTAALLKHQGHEVTGVTMKTWIGEYAVKKGSRHGCYGSSENEEIEAATRVACILGIPHHILDLKKEYKSEVLDYFCQQYLSGRTPNPCIRCNHRVKFDALVRKARGNGIEFDYFATGHYARVEYNEMKGRYLLRKAKDLKKDQSYFLFSLSQEQLSSSLFPLGEYTKEEVRDMALDFKLDAVGEVESQDFVEGGYHSLLRTATEPGPILDSQGNTVGKHQGISFYTIGQRKGLGISAREPFYVTGIVPDKNAIVVGKKEELYGDELVACELNWIAIKSLEQPIEAKTKIRYLHRQGADTVLVPLDEHGVHVKFKEPQMAITPGQAVVFYDDDTVLGGGIIESA